jgi:hypothetical protein
VGRRVGLGRGAFLTGFGVGTAFFCFGVGALALELMLTGAGVGAGAASMLRSKMLCCDATLGAGAVDEICCLRDTLAASDVASLPCKDKIKAGRTMNAWRRIHIIIIVVIFGNKP